jgi:hypothetical protein
MTLISSYPVHVAASTTKNKHSSLPPRCECGSTFVKRVAAAMLDKGVACAQPDINGERGCMCVKERRRRPPKKCGDWCDNFQCKSEECRFDMSSSSPKPCWRLSRASVRRCTVVWTPNGVAGALLCHNEVRMGIDATWEIPVKIQ